MSEKFKPQPGDVIEVSNRNESWHTRIFIEMGSNGHYGCFWDGDISVESMAQRVNGPFPWHNARPAIPMFGTHLTKPLSDLQQQWLALCPEFDTDNYEYEWNTTCKTAADNGGIIPIGQRVFMSGFDCQWQCPSDGVPYTILRRPKTPTFKLGEKFSFEGNNCMYVEMHEDLNYYKHGRLNLDTGVLENAWNTYEGFCNYHQSAIRGSQ